MSTNNKPFPFLNWCCFWIVIALTLPFSLNAGDRLHLLGFVERLCPGEVYCFDLLVKPEFVAAAGTHIRVRFASVINIYDPENYELSLQQQDIVPGSHLRMLIESEQNGKPDEYQASYIWIGD
ncbi:MAG: hypothetical protein GY896_06315 [Gammaproteobacteria bacterium]|nr:hypothetical protein [Gammaproteobacteria bacterium]